jgi:hypothetical protein
MLEVRGSFHLPVENILSLLMDSSELFQKQLPIPHSSAQPNLSSFILHLLRSSLHAYLPSSRSKIHLHSCHYVRPIIVQQSSIQKPRNAKRDLLPRIFFRKL